MSERLDALAAVLGETQYDRGSWHLLARCDHATLADAMRRAGIVADALVVDAPYSARTHAGQPDPGEDGTHRRPLAYDAWSDGDVEAFLVAWMPGVSGWIVSITDSELYPAWRRTMEAAYRLGFQPVPLIERGMTVRKTGDGPSSWATWAVVSRPRSRAWATWGTLPGAYVVNQEAHKDVVGGKPLAIMRYLVRDYSAPSDLVVDPCAGGGTTLVAAIELGRIAVGCEPDAGRYEIARARCAKARPQTRLALDVASEKRTQSALDLGVER